MRAFFIALAVLGAISAHAVPGTCRYKESCGYHCCRGTPGGSCLCSVCCNTREADLGPDDRFVSVTNGKRSAKIFRHRVEFYVGKNAKPIAARSFEEGIYPVDEGSGKSGLFALCTSSEWGVVPSSGAARGFCGTFRLDGKVVLELKAQEGPGLSREPVGVSPDGGEVVFAVTKARKSGDREVVGYRLWRKDRPEELLAPDAPRTGAVLEKYQGPLTLTNPHQAD